jgi:hypothetical protein
MPNVADPVMINEDQMSYKNFLRKSDGHFNYLLSKVEKHT